MRQTNFSVYKVCRLRYLTSVTGNGWGSLLSIHVWSFSFFLLVFVVIFGFSRQGLSTQPWGCPRTRRCTCLCLPGLGLKACASATRLPLNSLKRVDFVETVEVSLCDPELMVACLGFPRGVTTGMCQL